MINRLRWWCPSVHNFGDEVSPYLFNKITGQQPIHVGINHNEDLPHYCTVGSMIRECNENSIIWGSGYHVPHDTFRGKPLKIHAVRGPLTRDQLIRNGCECPEIYGDPALLLSRYFLPKVEMKYDIGVIPHYVDKKDPILNMFKSDAIKIIDIQSGVENVVKDILSCAMILSSGLHGIIAADSYGVPTHWFKMSNKITGGEYKYQDYYKSVGREMHQNYGMISEFTALPKYKIDIDLDKLMEACPFK